MTMILLYSQVGELSEEQLDFLVDNLEEEWPEDRDYFINRTMLELLKQRGADATLVRMLTLALGDREEVDILWVDTEELEDEDEDDGF
ncbi:MAG TPA: galactosyldiacylglycerol synthase [Dehalococcoidia bacterium]|nr:galactosyldiacylglycerol synthase [Dehalococcoidia bacterium]